MSEKELVTYTRKGRIVELRLEPPGKTQCAQP